MSINSNIIFTIGSKLGPGGFASLKAGFDMITALVGKVVDITEELDKSSQAWNRANRQAVLMADSAAAGLIDTNTIIKQHNALMAAGVELTDKQFRTIAARSVELAQATGQDATQAFERLTKSIQAGSTRALREYGVDLKDSGTLTDRQTDAVNQLTEGFDGLTASAETSTERLFALKNNIGTLTTFIWSSTGSSDTLAYALDEVNGAFSTFNEKLGKSPKAMTKFVESGYALQGFLAELEIQMLKMIFNIPIALERQTLKPSLFSNMLNLLFGGDKPAEVQGKGWLEQQIDDLREKMKETSREAVEVLNRMKDAIIEDDPRGRVRRPGQIRAGGAEGPGPDFGQDFLEEDLAQQRQFEEWKTDQEREQQEIREEERKKAHDARLQRMLESSQWQAEYFAALDEMERERLEKEEEAERIRRDRMTLGFHADKQQIKATETMWSKSLQSRAQMMGGFFGIVGSLQQSENEKAWKIGKAANIAKATIDTYTGAVAAYKAMAGIPYVGPFLGAAAAAAVTVMGLQAIRNIKATNFTDEGQPGFVEPPAAANKGVKSAAGALRSAARGPIPGVPSGAGQNTTHLERNEMTLTIVMKDEGAGLFDVVMDQNDRAGRDGRPSLNTRAA